jgi:hypothetical protein
VCVGAAGGNPQVSKIRDEGMVRDFSALHALNRPRVDLPKPSKEAREMLRELKVASQRRVQAIPKVRCARRWPVQALCPAVLACGGRTHWVLAAAFPLCLCVCFVCTVTLRCAVVPVGLYVPQLCAVGVGCCSAQGCSAEPDPCVGAGRPFVCCYHPRLRPALVSELFNALARPRVCPVTGVCRCQAPAA